MNLDPGKPASPPPLPALAQLAGGLAPTLNDLLTVITGRASLLLDHADPDGPTRESLRQIYTAGERAVSLIRQLLIFSGRETPQVHVLDLNRLVEDNRGVLHRVLGGDIAVELRLASGLLCLPADPGMMEQILLGLAWNALDAMPQGGRLLLTTAAANLGAAEAASIPGARPGRFVVLSVADTGVGIAPEVLPRIFEPFFTTKAAGRGTGLALATIYGIVQQHAGWIAVTSAPAAGAEFTVFLPAAPPEAQPATPAPTKGKTDGGSETILLVEDETDVREFTVAVLQDYGYRVLQATSGPEALAVWKWHGPRIALLLTDMILEGDQTGVELAATLRRQRPALAVICTSGHGREIMQHSAALPGGCHFLQKPCRPQVLARAIRSLLDGQTP